MELTCIINGLTQINCNYTGDMLHAECVELYSLSNIELTNCNVGNSFAKVNTASKEIIIGIGIVIIVHFNWKYKRTHSIKWYYSNW